MNKGRIKSTLDGFFRNFFTQLFFDENLRKRVATNCYIAGGAIASLAMNKTPRDIDIYCQKKGLALDILSYFLNKPEFSGCSFTYFDDQEKIVLYENDHRTTYLKPTYTGVMPKANTDGVKIITPNAISLIVDNQPCQIVLRFAGTPMMVISEFDYTYCKAFNLPGSTFIHIDQEAWDAIINKELVYTGSKYPLSSMIRMVRKEREGWRINANNLVKIGFQISQLNLADPLVFEDQLIGIDILLFNHLLKLLREDFERNPDITISTGMLNVLIEQSFEDLNI